MAPDGEKTDHVQEENSKQHRAGSTAAEPGGTYLMFSTCSHVAKDASYLTRWLVFHRPFAKPTQHVCPAW